MSTVYPFCSEGIIKSDGSIMADSTCGFRTDLVEIADGQMIVDYSGGFCCSCPVMTVFTGIQEGLHRGNCGLLSSDETAHCLDFSDTLFAGYSIGDYYYDYDIKIDLAYAKGGDKGESEEGVTGSSEEGGQASDSKPDPGSSSEDETSDVLNPSELESASGSLETQNPSPQSKVNEQTGPSQASRLLADDSETDIPVSEPAVDASSDDPTSETVSTESTGSDSYELISETLSINNRLVNNGILLAEIVGDFMPIKSPPGLKNKIFLRPLPKVLPSDVSGNVQNDWLIVDSDMVSMDGSECDKIGWIIFIIVYFL